MLLHQQPYDQSIYSLHHQNFQPSFNLNPRNLHLDHSSTANCSFQQSLTSFPPPMPTHQPTSKSTLDIRPYAVSPLDGEASDRLAKGASYLGSDLGSGGFSNGGYLDIVPQQAGHYLKRLSSGSSVDSAGPPSPHDQVSPQCQVATGNSPRLSNLEISHRLSSSPRHTHLTKSLPTPATTPTAKSHMPPGYQNVSTAQQDNYHQRASLAYGRVRATAGNDGDVPLSASTMSQTSPATPQTHYERDQETRNFAPGETIQPNLDHWFTGPLRPDSGHSRSAAFTEVMQEVFADHLYDTQSPVTMPPANSHLPTYRSMHMFGNQIHGGNTDQAAQRTGSPVTGNIRERSPFETYHASPDFGHGSSPQNSMTAMTQTMMEQSRETAGPKSISPKELMLEVPGMHNDSNPPLFPRPLDQSAMYSNAEHNPSMPSYGDQDSMFGAAMSSGAAAPVGQIPVRYPFMSNRRRTPSNLVHESDAVPEFPARLVSMETTVEEGPSESGLSRQTSLATAGEEISRPDETSADSGTYTCTYHGCTMRFDMPAKLQKHKRETHRHTSPTAGPVSSPTGPTSLSLRNSQAGPHRCERINPSTGKACSSIFSRPYDLTRHEDTIHNARKLKVRCHLCTEEKTFSRTDALTRHMRVVHPDVEWPGKTRRGK